MASLDDGFKHDIFISYRHNDNRSTFKGVLVSCSIVIATLNNFLVLPSYI